MRLLPLFNGRFHCGNTLVFAPIQKQKYLLLPFSGGLYCGYSSSVGAACNSSLLPLINRVGSIAVSRGSAYRPGRR